MQRCNPLFPYPYPLSRFAFKRKGEGSRDREVFMEIILTSLSLGLLATTSPCVLPLYPGFLAYLSGGQEGLQNKAGRYFLGFFVLAGVLTMMLVLGGIIALLSI